MANTRNRGRETDAETQSSQQDEQRRGGQSSQGIQRSSGRQQMMPYRSSSPFQLMRQMSEDVDRMFERFFGDFGFPRRTGAFASNLFGGTGGEMTTWSPRIEAYQKEDKFIIRAELPGVSREDVTLDVDDDAITLHGQRKHEQEEEREGFYHSEWSYGSFSRTIPLPEGAIVENAEASFRDGVLSITIPAPPSGVRQSRRIEIQEGSDTERDRNKERGQNQ